MGQFRSFLSWYRLKSNQEHLFVKMSGRRYLEEQPATTQETDDLIKETISATREIHTICEIDSRILVIAVDLRDFSASNLNLTLFLRYITQAASQGCDIERIEVIGVSDFWPLISNFLPKYARDRIVYI